MTDIGPTLLLPKEIVHTGIASSPKSPCLSTCNRPAFEPGTRPRTAPYLCCAAKVGPKRALQNHPPTAGPLHSADVSGPDKNSPCGSDSLSGYFPKPPLRSSGSAREAPVKTQPKQTKTRRLISERSSDREWDYRLSSRLPMPEPGVPRPKKTAQLSEPQASFERSGRGAPGGGNPPSSAIVRRRSKRYGGLRWAMAGIGIGHLGGPGGPG